MIMPGLQRQTHKIYHARAASGCAGKNGDNAKQMPFGHAMKPRSVSGWCEKTRGWNMRLVAGNPYSFACQSESHNSGFSSRGRPSCKKSWWPLRSSNKNAWRLQNASSERQAKRKSLHHFVPPTPIYWSYGGRSGHEMSSELYSSTSGSGYHYSI